MLDLLICVYFLVQRVRYKRTRNTISYARPIKLWSDFVDRRAQTRASSNGKYGSPKRPVILLISSLIILHFLLFFKLISSILSFSFALQRS